MCGGLHIVTYLPALGGRIIRRQARVTAHPMPAGAVWPRRPRGVSDPARLRRAARRAGRRVSRPRDHADARRRAGRGLLRPRAEPGVPRARAHPAARHGSESRRRRPHRGVGAALVVGSLPRTAAPRRHTRRQVIKVNGRPPRKNDYRACTTPEQESTETQPLSMLLVEQRDDYTFALAGLDRVDKRPAIRVDYKLKAKPTVEVKMVEGLDDCVSYDVSGGRQGRLWIDAETFDVLRARSAAQWLRRVPAAAPRLPAGPGVNPVLDARAARHHHPLQAGVVRRAGRDAGPAGVADVDQHHPRRRDAAAAHQHRIPRLQALHHRRAG